MERILVVHTGGIGDWVLFTPVVRVLKETWPGGDIDVILGTPMTRQVVDLYPDVQVRAVTNVRRGLWGILQATVKTWSTKYDVALFTAGVDSQKADTLALLINAREKLAIRNRRGRHRFLTGAANYDMSIHQIENNLKLLSLLGIDQPKSFSPVLPFDELCKTIPESVLIHPGSDYAFKRWPLSNFLQVAENLLRRRWVVSVVLGPSEMDLREALAPLCRHDRFRLYHGMSLREVLSLVSRHQVILNNDSGLGHLAAALQKRVVSIFGPGDPTLFRPYGSDVCVVRTCKPPECMPCMRPGGAHGCSDPVCMVGVEPDVVMEAVTGGCRRLTNAEVIESAR